MKNEKEARNKTMKTNLERWRGEIKWMSKGAKRVGGKLESHSRVHKWMKIIHFALFILPPFATIQPH